MAPKRKADELGPGPTGDLHIGKEDPKKDNNGTGQHGVSACLTRRDLSVTLKDH